MEGKQAERLDRFAKPDVPLNRACGAGPLLSAILRSF